MTESSGTNIFLKEVLTGLKASPKYLQSKYFYDAAGDKIFQQIMHSPEYYPTNCELEILSQQTREILNAVTERHSTFDLIELGAGDALKSSYLLKGLVENRIDFSYYPIDISANVIDNLSKNLPQQIPGIAVQGLNGEYFKMLEKARSLSSKPKVILFLGSNLGNMRPEQALTFCRTLKEHLAPGDLLLIGLDLKKDPQTILSAYNDKQGYTRNFNLNLLHRINTELNADFDPAAFQHFPTYNPETGACQSYLVSMKDQQVRIGDQAIRFGAWETIHMEISQKYTVSQTDDLAASAGFVTLRHFFDSKRWFVDTIWECR